MRFGERTRSGTSVSGWTKRGAGKSTLAVEFLLVGGGGGGGQNGGGGGAGGMRTGSGIIGKTTYTVTVGAGGAVNQNGTASSFIASANGGGAGGRAGTSASIGVGTGGEIGRRSRSGRASVVVVFVAVAGRVVEILAGAACHGWLFSVRFPFLLLQVRCAAASGLVLSLGRM